MTLPKGDGKNFEDFWFCGQNCLESYYNKLYTEVHGEVNEIRISDDEDDEIVAHESKEIYDPMEDF